MSEFSVLETHLEPLRPLLDAEDVTELVINRPGEAGLERYGKWEWHDLPQLSAAFLGALARGAAAVTKQNLDQEKPLCSTVLPTGERVQIVMPPACEMGQFSITIRKPSVHKFSLEDLGGTGLFQSTQVAGVRTTSAEAELEDLYRARAWQEFLGLAVLAKKNILISGSTGSGKTTLAKALVARVPVDERVLTIEDTRELEVPHRNRVHLLYSKGEQGRSKATAKDLLEASLRMRPDRIFLQELRDGNAFFYLRNVNSGHPGSITTVHASSALQAFEQLALLVKESEGGRDLARDDIRQLLGMLVDIVVQCEKVDGRFRATEIYYRPTGVSGTEPSDNVTP